MISQTSVLNDQLLAMNKEVEKTVYCEYCGSKLTNHKKKIKNHLKQAHYPEYIKLYYPPSKKVQKNGLKNIMLISERGSKAKGEFTCSNCCKTVPNPTRYSASNFGPVYLCAICKPRIREQSFGRKNSRYVQVVSGGRCS